MLDPRSVRFYQIATRCSLIEQAKLDECWNAIPADKRTPDAIDRRMARQAVNSGYLTLWQAQQLLAGRQHGLRIERYVLLDQIGHGGMGRVYLARDTRLGRHVALKVLSRERMSNPRALARFKREAKLGAQLQHENLVRIYDEGEVMGMPYLVMEYIIGQTVGQMIADQGRIEPSTAAELGRQVALGLEHLHQKGLLHRDVNPTNVLIDRGGSVKITDLGLAIDLGDAEDVVTRDGATVGTFDYISPEQARNPRQIDTRSDIYSLGCTLYHMISGRVPFPAPSLPEKLFAHQSKEPEPLVGQVAAMPPALERVIQKMMSKKPEERFARPALVARALEPFARNGRVVLDEPSTPPQRTPSSITLGDAAAKGGSDPDLAILPAAPRERTAANSSDPFEFVKLDLAAEPLSETRTSARSHSQDNPSLWVKGPRLWLAAAAIVGLVGLLFVILTQAGGRRPNATLPTDITNAPATLAKSDIMVEYDNGDAVAAANLVDAIRRAVNKRAKVVLRNKTPIIIGSLQAQQLRLTTGRVIIEAGPGARPVIQVLLNAATPAIQVGANSAMTLSGITFTAERTLKEPNLSPAVIQAIGNLRLENCAIVLRGKEKRARAVLAEGNLLEMANCFVCGFDSPVTFNPMSVNGAVARIGHSMLIGVLEENAPRNSTSGWPIVLNIRQSARPAVRPVPPQVHIDHCTIVGAGLVRFDGPLDKVKLTLDINNTVVSGRALAMWPNLPFPASVVWNGRDNCYSLSFDELIVCSPSSAAVLDALKDLATLNAFPAWKEVDSHERLLRFAVEPVTAASRPADLKLETVVNDAGADPSKVADPGP